MKEYYIFINEERKGPLTFEELKAENISNDTLVWYEGIPEWKNAGEIEELKKLFKAIPPPIGKINIPPIPVNKQNVLEEDDEPATILGLSKKVFYGIALVVIIGILVFYNYQSNEADRIQRLNNATEAHNEQLELQQKEIEEQKARIAEQEQIEAQRRKEAIDRRIIEIQNLLVQNNQALEKAKRNLNDVTAFKFLRTSSERNAQINAAQSNIDRINEQIRRLEEELKQLNSEG